MSKPIIFIITKNFTVYEEFRKRLREIFGHSISIVSNHFPPVNVNEVDLILTSGSKELDLEFIEPQRGRKPILTANRSIDFSKLEKLLDLPTGTSCLLVSNEIHIAKDSVELLQRMGFNQLQMIAYSPDMDPMPNLTGVEVAITHGLPELVPPAISRIIDLGDRSLDLSTIFEISRILQISVEKAHLFTADFFRNFVRIGKRLSHFIQKEKRLNQQLETVLNAVHEGIIWVDPQGFIVVFNKEASNILGIKYSDAIQHHFTEIFHEFDMNEFSEVKSEMAPQVIQIRGLQLLIARTPFVVDDVFMGALINFQDVTYVQRMEEQIRRKKTESGLTTKYTFSEIIGSSQAIEQVRTLAGKIAKSDYTVLISGESGTGKEIFAQAIHNASPRKSGPFLAVNFAGLSTSLAESELFGYEEGAFTGARKGGKTGLFELAQNGTIFLDEIGDAPLSIQAALLRVLQERQVMRVGGSKVIPINVRVIAATNKNLYDMMEKGTFREDLFYRLNELPLSLPSLEERKQDIDELINYFLKRRNHRLFFSKEAMKVLFEYNWPGNIRELEALINYLTVTVDKHTIEVEHLPERMRLNKMAYELDSDEVIHCLEGHGDITHFRQILNVLANANTGLGRASLAAMIEAPLSEGQLRTKLSILKKYRCVYSGRKKQGTQITDLGKQVLKNLKQQKQ